MQQYSRHAKHQDLKVPCECHLGSREEERKQNQSPLSVFFLAVYGGLYWSAAIQRPFFAAALIILSIISDTSRLGITAFVTEKLFLDTTKGFLETTTHPIFASCLLAVLITNYQVEDRISEVGVVTCVRPKT